jgi:hypothetical protein
MANDGEGRHRQTGGQTTLLNLVSRSLRAARSPQPLPSLGWARYRELLESIESFLDRAAEYDRRASER